MNDMNEIEFLHRFLTKNFDTSNYHLMVDVGAQTGYSLRPFVNDGWQVYAFEPDRESRRPLERLSKRSENLYLDTRAVSNQEEKAKTFYRSNISNGISSLLPFHPSHTEAETVEVTTLRTFCSEQHITQVDFLKIDAEGYDLLVLQGFPFESIRPRVIMCEFEDLKTLHLGYRFHDMAVFLESRGYSLLVSEWYPIVQYGTKHKWRRFAFYPCELLHPDAWGNLLAFNEAGALSEFIEINQLEVVNDNSG